MVWLISSLLWLQEVLICNYCSVEKWLYVWWLHQNSLDKWWWWWSIQYDKSAFLFSLSDGKQPPRAPVKLTVKPDQQDFAVGHDSDCGPTFGDGFFGHDLVLFGDNFGNSANNLGKCYNLSYINHHNASNNMSKIMKMQRATLHILLTRGSLKMCLFTLSTLNFVTSSIYFILFYLFI